MLKFTALILMILSHDCLATEFSIRSCFELCKNPANPKCFRLGIGGMEDFKPFKSLFEFTHEEFESGIDDLINHCKRTLTKTNSKVYSKGNACTYNGLIASYTLPKTLSATFLPSEVNSEQVDLIFDDPMARIRDPFNRTGQLIALSLTSRGELMLVSDISCYRYNENNNVNY